MFAPEMSMKYRKHITQSPSHILIFSFLFPGEAVGVGSVAGGGRYDDLVGMFAAKGRKVRLG
jgi:histidyl-tRNA synthetase